MNCSICRGININWSIHAINTNHYYEYMLDSQHTNLTNPLSD